MQKRRDMIYSSEDRQRGNVSELRFDKCVLSKDRISGIRVHGWALG